MRHSPIAFIFLFVPLITFLFFAHLSKRAAQESRNSRISISKYTELLNGAATSDLHHLYNEKMADIPQAKGGILRMGIPGSYVYEAPIFNDEIESFKTTQDALITFLSLLDAECYALILQEKEGKDIPSKISEEVMQEILDEVTQESDAAPKLEVFLGQHQCAGEPGVDCRNRVRLGAARKGEPSRCERVNMYSYSRCQASSLALPHQTWQPSRHDQHEISGLNHHEEACLHNVDPDLKSNHSFFVLERQEENQKNVTMMMIPTMGGVAEPFIRDALGLIISGISVYSGVRRPLQHRERQPVHNRICDTCLCAESNLHTRPSYEHEFRSLPQYIDERTSSQNNLDLEKIRRASNNEKLSETDFFNFMNTSIQRNNNNTHLANSGIQDSEKTPLLNTKSNILPITQVTSPVKSEKQSPLFLGLKHSDDEGSELITKELSSFSKISVFGNPPNKSNSRPATALVSLLNATLTEINKTENTSIHYINGPIIPKKALHEPEPKEVEPTQEELECLLPDESKKNYGTFKSSSNMAITHQKVTSHDHSAIINFLLERALKSQSDLKNAMSNKRADEKMCCLHAYNNYRNSAEEYVHSHENNFYERANLYQKIAQSYDHAASEFKKVTQLAQPDAQTGPLLLYMRPGQEKIKTKHNLSQFSFERKGSMEDYYTLITSPYIVGGSNINSIKNQKEAIERAQKSLKRATEDLNAMRFLVY